MTLNTHMYSHLPISGTFDLKEVIVTPIDDRSDRNLCVTCTLRRGSNARGCLVSLKLQKGNETEPSNFTVGKDEQCMIQESGLYTVEVFDYHADGNLSALAAYSQENFRIPRPNPVRTVQAGKVLATHIILCMLRHAIPV